MDLGGLFLRYREEGDLSAFQSLMEALHRPLFNYLLRLLHNRDNAEDALQEVWFKVIRQRASYNEQGHFSSWIYRIAHNHCLDLFRQQGHMRMEERMDNRGEEEGDILERIAASEPSPRESLNEKERLALLEDAIGRLPETIREVYILRAVHDISFKEIAEIQNAPLGTVLSRMHQAVNYLKKWIAESPASAEELA